MIAAGLISGLDALVNLPQTFVTSALVLAAAAAAVFFVATWRQARRAGRGVISTMGHTLWDTLRAIFTLIF